MATDEKIRYEKVKYDISRAAAKISTYPHTAII